MKRILFFTWACFALFSNPSMGQSIAAPSPINLFLQASADSSLALDTTTFQVMYPLMNFSNMQQVSFTSDIDITFDFQLPDTTTVDSMILMIGGVPGGAEINHVEWSIANSSYADSTVNIQRSGLQVNVTMLQQQYGEYFYGVQLFGSGLASPLASPTHLSIINL